MRLDTKQKVESLELQLRCPREGDIESIAAGLAGFRTIRIQVTRLGLLDVPTRLRQRCALGRLCRSIAEKRKRDQRTVWDDSGDIENAYMFQLYLPSAYETYELTQYEKLEMEAAWL